MTTQPSYSRKPVGRVQQHDRLLPLDAELSARRGELAVLREEQLVVPVRRGSSGRLRIVIRIGQLPASSMLADLERRARARGRRRSRASPGRSRSRRRRSLRGRRSGTRLRTRPRPGRRRARRTPRVAVAGCSWAGPGCSTRAGILAARRATRGAPAADRRRRAVRAHAGGARDRHPAPRRRRDRRSRGPVIELVLLEQVREPRQSPCGCASSPCRAGR